MLTTWLALAKKNVWDFSSNSNKQTNKIMTSINVDLEIQIQPYVLYNYTTIIVCIQGTMYTHSAKHPLVRPMNDQRCVVHCLNVPLLMSSATMASFPTSLPLPLSNDLTESLPLWGTSAAVVLGESWTGFSFCSSISVSRMSSPSMSWKTRVDFNGRYDKRWTGKRHSSTKKRSVD